jgi:hypothetical protein
LREQLEQVQNFSVQRERVSRRGALEMEFRVAALIMGFKNEPECLKPLDELRAVWNELPN